MSKDEMVFEVDWMDDSPLFICHPACSHHSKDTLIMPEHTERKNLKKGIDTEDNILYNLE